MQTTNADGPLLLSIPQTQERLGGIGRTSVYELIKSGRLKAVHIGRRTFVPADECDRLVDELKTVA